MLTHLSNVLNWWRMRKTSMVVLSFLLCFLFQYFRSWKAGPSLLTCKTTLAEILDFGSPRVFCMEKRLCAIQKQKKKTSLCNWYNCSTHDKPPIFCLSSPLFIRCCFSFNFQKTWRSKNALWSNYSEALMTKNLKVSFSTVYLLLPL